MGTSVRVRISQAEFENGIADCRFNLHGRITLNKGDTPYTAQALKLKLNNLWPNLRSWHLIPLGRGYYEFGFSSLEDMRRIWALGVVHIKPGFLRCFRWTKWLLDVDLSDKMFESVVIESEGHALSIQVKYEKYPSFCAHCRMLGHTIQNCLKLSASNQHDATSIRDKAIPATGKVIRNQNQKVKPNPSSHFNMFVQPVVHNSEVHGSPLVADSEQILNISHIVVPDSFVSTNMVPKIVPISLDNTFGILNELEPASDGSTQILSDKELSPENSVRKLDCGNILTWNNSFTMLNEDFPPLNGAAKISEQIGFSTNPGQASIPGNVQKHVDTPSTVLVTKKLRNQSSQAHTTDSISEPDKVQEAPTESWPSQPLHFVSDKSVLNHISGYAMPQPITTYHSSLSADKLPILKPLVYTANACSSEAQRSVDILQKFWGDYTNEEHESSLVCPSAARIKKQKKQTNRQVSPKSTKSEHIQTRSKKGVIKSNPKYCD